MPYSLEYLPGTFPAEYGGILGELDWLVGQVPRWVKEGVGFVVPLWRQWWWLVFVVAPVYVALETWWTAFEGANISGQIGLYRHRVPSPSAGDPKWRWRVWRFWRWIKEWLLGG